jgi:hypothetical protein
MLKNKAMSAKRKIWGWRIEKERKGQAPQYGGKKRLDFLLTVSLSPPPTLVVMLRGS